MSEHQAHPYAEIFPLGNTAGPEWEAFKASVADGLNHHVVLFEGKVLDGRRRCRALGELGRAVTTTEFRGTQSEALRFSIDENLHRRHLDKGQLAMVGVTIKREYEAIAAEKQQAALQRGRDAQTASRNGSNPIAANLPQSTPDRSPDSRTVAAQAVGVSPRTIDAAEQVVESGVPELKQMVIEGKAAVSAAAAIATLPAEHQHAVIEGGPERVKRAAAEMRQAPKPTPPPEPEPEDPAPPPPDLLEEPDEPDEEPPPAPDRTPLPMARGGTRLGANGEAITLDDWKAMRPELRLPGGVLETLQEGSSKRFNDQKDNENIEWALWSWNPVTGCLHDCPYCYARDIANRFYETKFEPAVWPARLAAPKNTPFPAAKAAEWVGHKNVFTCSMADLFGRWVPREWIDAVLDACREAPQWNFLFLSKFPQRMAEFDFPDNAWVGTSVDQQARVANAEKAFKKIKAGVKWLSCEPLTEPLKFADLGVFDWLVIGGSSASTQTPEWDPPRRWTTEIEAEAYRLGVKVYEKSNLKLRRVRQYPGVDSPEPEAPASLKLLPTATGRQ